MKKIGLSNWFWIIYSGVLLILHIVFGVTGNLGLVAVIAVVAFPAHIFSPYLHISMFLPDVTGWLSLILNWLWFSLVAGVSYYLLIKVVVIGMKHRTNLRSQPD